MTKLEAAPPPHTAPMVRMSAVAKRFGQVISSRDVQFELRGDEIRVVAGQNGSGNSALLGNSPE